ncbi:MAG: Ig-like domain-containing protein [Allomuricauda sp.]
MKKIAFPIVLVLSLCVAVLSCNRDDGPTGPDPIYGYPNLNLLTPTPNTGPVGTVFTITGQSFSSVPSENIVMIGDAVAPVVSALPYALRAVVPDGAVTGAISVTVKGVTLDGNTFTVTEVPVTAVALDRNGLTLYPYPQYATVLQVTSDVGDNTVIWSSSDETVAAVDENGLVTPLAIGEATITAMVGNGSAQCNVEVVDGPVTDLQLDLADLELYRGGSATLSIDTFEAEVEQTGDVVWSSDNGDVATVDQDGTVTALAVGTTTITVSVDNASASCTVTVNPNVYVAGGFTNLNGTDVARIWINGTATDITDGSNNAFAISMFVDKDDRVHVVGSEKINGVDTAMLWELEGGEVVKAAQLPSQGNEAYARSVFVNDNGISFVAGWQIHNGAYEAMLWRNQVANPLPGMGSESSGAHSVSVDGGGNVYVVGYEYINGIDTARIWENGVPIDLPMPGTVTQSGAFSVYVDGDDVYVAGFYRLQDPHYIATVWKNGIVEEVGDGTTSTFAWSVFVSDGDVYVGGNEQAYLSNDPKLWKNGVASDLLGEKNTSSSSPPVRSVFVYGADVYVAGSILPENGSFVAILWKNGMPINLEGGEYATSVFVK